MLIDQKLDISVGSVLGLMGLEVYYFRAPSQPAITCSKLTIETLEQGVKYVQS